MSIKQNLRKKLNNKKQLNKKIKISNNNSAHMKYLQILMMIKNIINNWRQKNQLKKILKIYSSNNK